MQQAVRHWHAWEPSISFVEDAAVRWIFIIQRYHRSDGFLDQIRSGYVSYYYILTSHDIEYSPFKFTCDTAVSLLSDSDLDYEQGILASVTVRTSDLATKLAF
jgi:hypothetical protein